MFNPNLCLECNQPLMGRSDKKYCDIHCKAAFNNRKNKEKEFVLHYQNHLLRINRKILKSLSPAGKSTVRKEELTIREFRFDLFTKIWKSKNGLYFFSYDWGYMPISDPRNIQKAVIVRYQEFMEKSSFDPWSFLSS